MTPAAVQGAAAAVLMTFGLCDLALILRARRGRPLGLARLAQAVRRLTPQRDDGRSVSDLVTAAGLAGSVSGPDVMALKSAAALVAGAATAALFVISGSRGVLVAGTAAAAAAFLAPDLILRRRVAGRRRRLALELPGVLDLLAVAVRAGMPATMALELVGERHSGLLGRELHRACALMALGESRAGALGELAARCPHEGVAAAVAALIRSDRHGVALAPALASVSVAARRARARAVHEHAARAAPKIQLVIALGLVPATMLLVAAGLVSALA